MECKLKKISEVADLEAQINNSNIDKFNKNQLEMYVHFVLYGVKIIPYVKEKFPKEYEMYELYEVLGEYFTQTAKNLKALSVEEE